ncbi:MAG: hypothetical protein J0J06_16620 [Sphingomonas sp.]|uniref:hypothetical protein n=1 Tax=Sphingomonas sp. TaxID=28214 RepID=UPI001AD1C8FD|nr:hypothetical protein [Sphingomonas sp.]MBN8817054.1 hypothetical protein [Sphingomonas sp.]
MIRKLLLSAATLSMVPASANATWYRATSDHFVVYDNDSAEKVKAFTEKLERFDKAMSVWHVTPELKRGPASRVTIFVVDGIGDIQRLSSPGVAGFYNPQASGSVAFTPRSDGGGELSSQAILFHEYAHHWMFLHWADAGFPYWFVEGFAELHATAIVDPDQSYTFGAPPIYRRWTVGNSGLMPADDLLKAMPSDRLTGGSRDAVYSRGWLLVHYLTFDAERRKDLAQYIGAINGGTPVKEAARIIGNPNTLDAKMDVWAKQRKYPSARFTAAELPIGTVTLTPLAAGAAAIMPALIESKAGVSKKDAANVVAMARRLAAPYPNDADAQNELAEAEFDVASVLYKEEDAKALAGFALAEAAADRAIAADPKSIHALIYKGLAQAEIAARNKVTDPAKWQAIRRWFLMANKIDTEDPAPLYEYYKSFEKAGQKPNANADKALIYAYALAPYDSELRLVAARVFLRQDNVKYARVALAPVAYSAEDRKVSTKAQKALAAIEAKDIPGAITMLEAKDDDDKKGDKGKGS